MRLVYVTKRGSKEKYLVLATTQYKLHPQEIIQLYGCRWQSIDDRTLGDLFYLMNEALPDLAFEEALVCLLTALKEVKAEISATVEQILDNFIKLLPVFMQKQLLRTA
ncbi:hypothetical protein AO203_00545 [Lactobacillus gallinarum]|nr:hypothetical protein AO203_00545 [Lactobacillus gallinarum]